MAALSAFRFQTRPEGTGFPIAAPTKSTALWIRWTSSLGCYKRGWRMKSLTLLPTLAMALSVAGCEQMSCSSHETVSSIEVPANTKIVAVNWEGESLRILVRPMQGNETAARWQLRKASTPSGTCERLLIQEMASGTTTLAAPAMITVGN